MNNNIIDRFRPKPEAADKPRMPRGGEPPEPPHPHRYAAIVGDYADEAKRAAQRVIDQAAEIDALRTETDSWKNRCHVLELQLQQMARDHTRLAIELDEHKRLIAVVSTQYSIASKVFLDGVSALAQLGGDLRKPDVDLGALAVAINDPVDHMEVKEGNGGPD